jgi:hypothetical protein
MAIINIENAEVLRTISQKGFACAENYTTKDGQERQNKFTIWCKPEDIPAEGSTVNVSGVLTTRMENYNGRDFVGQHVNFPRVETVKEAVVEQAPENWPIDSNTPF